MTADGIEGDRRYAIFDLDTGHGLTGRRVPELLFAAASLTADGGVSIILPDGTAADGDEMLSDWLGRRVALRRAEENISRQYEDVIDFEREQTSAWKTFDVAPGPFHDSPRARVSLASTDTIGAWGPRRFRANILLDGNGEDALVGSSIALGDALLHIEGLIQRCVMVTRPHSRAASTATSTCYGRSRATEKPASQSARSSAAPASPVSAINFNRHSWRRGRPPTSSDD